MHQNILPLFLPFRLVSMHTTSIVMHITWFKQFDYRFETTKWTYSHQMELTAKTLVIASTFCLRLEAENIYTFAFQQSTHRISTLTVNGIVHISQRVAHKEIFSCCPFMLLFCCSCQGHCMGKGGVDRICYMSSVITLTLHFPMGNHVGEGKSLTGSFPC